MFRSGHFDLGEPVFESPDRSSVRGLSYNPYLTNEILTDSSEEEPCWLWYDYRDGRLVRAGFLEDTDSLDQNQGIPVLRDQRAMSGNNNAPSAPAAKPPGPYSVSPRPALVCGLFFFYHSISWHLLCSSQVVSHATPIVSETLIA